MKPIKIKKNFTISDKYYFAGDILEEDLDYETIVKLNEKGFIEPLTMKDLTLYKKYGNKVNKKNKEEIE